MDLEKLKRSLLGRTPGLMDATGQYSVLVPLVEREGGLSLLYEVRAGSLRRQPGEVCFPGGRLEGAESPEECALRETWEELGIPREEIRVFGKSDFLCSHRGFLLQPVLAAVSPAGLAALRPSPAEVAEVFSVPLSFFRRQQPEVYRYELVPTRPDQFPYGAVGIPETYRWARGTVEVPVWFWEGHAIWGMTARIVRDLIKE